MARGGNPTDSYPGAKVSIPLPYVPADCCAMATLPLLIAALESAGYPYTVKGSLLLIEATPAQVTTICQGTPPDFFIPLGEPWHPTHVENADIDGAVIGPLVVHIADTNNWATATVKVLQPDAQAVSAILMQLTVVQGGLTVPGTNYVFHENACGARSVVGGAVSMVGPP